MAEEKIMYARSGGPPANWRDLEVLLNGKIIPQVFLVSALEGWLKVRGKGGGMVTMRGNIEIRVRKRENPFHG